MTLTSLEITQMNSTQSQRKEISHYLHLTDLFFSPPDLKAQYLTTFFSFCTYIFACNTAFSLCLPLKIDSYFSLNLASGQ